MLKSLRAVLLLSLCTLFAARSFAQDDAQPAADPELYSYDADAFEEGQQAMSLAEFFGADDRDECISDCEYTNNWCMFLAGLTSDPVAFSECLIEHTECIDSCPDYPLPPRTPDGCVYGQRCCEWQDPITKQECAICRPRSEECINY